MSQQFDVRIIEQSADGRSYRAEVKPVENIVPGVLVVGLVVCWMVLDELSKSLGITIEQAVYVVLAGVFVVGVSVVALIWRYGPAIRRFFNGE